MLKHVSYYRLNLVYLTNTFYAVITPYVRILDFDWLIASVFFTNLLLSNEYGSFFNAAGVFAKRICLFYPLCRGICQQILYPTGRL